MSIESPVIRSAVIGFGRNGAAMHGEPLRDLPAFNLVAAVDIDLNRQSLAENDFGATFFTDHKEMLATIQPELTVVVTRNDQHSPMAIDCLEAGSHVLVTKPWALNKTEADRMIAAAKHAKRQVLPWLPMRFSPEAIRVRDLIRSGVIGQVFLVRRVVNSFSVRADWQTSRQCGGGYLLNWGPHIVEPAYWILDTTVHSVNGFLRQAIGRGDVEDLFFADLTLENGAHAFVEHSLTPVLQPRWLVQGTLGSIVVQGKEITVHQAEVSPAEIDITARDTPKAVPVREWSEPADKHIYGDTLEAYKSLGRHLRGDPHAGFDASSALHLTQVLDAIRQSDSTKTIVEINSPGAPCTDANE